jgi:aminoglycoside phosphotransferase (APT) family kinase protein
LARDTIRENLGNAALDRWQRGQLRGIISNCDLVELEWDRTEQFCRSMPTTLVHGDFIGKNVRMRSRPEGMEILAFDWEVAGRGIPAVDLAQATLSSTGFLANPDLEAYWATVHHTGLGFEAVQRLGVYGTIFRCLAALSWESRSLVHPWPEWPVKNMAKYEAELLNAARTAGWRM